MDNSDMEAFDNVIRARLDNPDDEVLTLGEFRRRFRLCPKGHKRGISTNESCWICTNNERMENCLHDGRRYWENPSNLSGDNRFVCSACGKSGLPPPKELSDKERHVVT